MRGQCWLDYCEMPFVAMQRAYVRWRASCAQQVCTTGKHNDTLITRRFLGATPPKLFTEATAVT